MTKFTEKATAITPNREIQPDEYFNETDHLIYCSKCNTPRQCRHELQVLWSSIFVTLVAKKYHESVTLPSGLRMVYDNH